MKRIISNIVLSIIIMLMLNPMIAYAAEDEEVGIEVSYTTERQEYEAEEEIISTLKIKNPNEYALENFTARIDVPLGYVVKNIEEIPKNITLQANSKDTFKIILAKEGIASVSDDTTSNWWMWIFVLIVLIIVAVLGVLFYKKKKGITASVLVFCILTGTCTPLCVQAEEMQRYKTEVMVDVAVAGEMQTIKVNLSFDCNEESSGIRIRTSDFGYSSENEAYTISGKLSAISGWLDNANEYTEIILHVYDNYGNLIVDKSTSATEEWTFKNIGLFPGKNYIEVQAHGTNEVSAGLFLIDIFGSNYYELDNSEIDTDGDGLYDLMERSLNTDINDVDTDKDGLTDYQEACELSTDPLLVDTDGDGIDDYNEDNDEDTIINGEEYILGTSPIREDTDFDGLSDNEEIYGYLTSAIRIDTDDDGANDYWEINNGYDPLVFNSSFDISISSNVVSEATPISVEVQANISSNNADLETLSVEKVYSYDNPYISPFIAGYLGDAYEIMLNGEIDEATLTFNYDTRLGDIGEEFQPRIYYFNEESKRFEELENQVVESGVVTADTTHFSTYTLLNKVAVDAAWSGSISTKEEAKAYLATELLFVMDRSASMCTEENNGLGKNVIAYFIDNMRDGYDKAAIMTFTKATELLSEFTYDKEMLMDLISGVNYDNGVNRNSGTDGTKALYDAVEMVADSTGGNKYVIYISDGDDNSRSYSYKEIKDNAIEQGVEIYVINIGEKDAGELECVASDTGGAYIEIGKDTVLSDELETIIAEIMAKTTDINNDGISDYYTELIKEGQLFLSNGSDELSGWDLNYDYNGNISDDCDGDGLKNGEEIQIVTDGSSIYIKMVSNPIHEHSDGDGINDYQEFLDGSDPLRRSVNKQYVDALLDDNYYYENFWNNYDESLFMKGFTGFTAALFGVWNKDELYRDLMIDYYNNYATIETLDGQELIEQKRLWTEYISTLLKGTKNVTSNMSEWYNDSKKLHKLWNYINGVTDKKQINNDFTNQITALIVKWNAVSEDATQMRFDCAGLEYTKKLLNSNDVQKYVTRSTKTLDKVSKYTGWISFGVDIADTINNLAKVNANSEVFEANLDELEYIVNNSEDKYARNAAKMIRAQLAGNYANVLIAVVDDVAELGMKHIIKAVASKNIYVAAVVLVRDITDILFGISEDVKQEYKMLCYHELSEAGKYYLMTCLSINGNYYEIADSKQQDFIRFAVHLAQLRILGERQFYQWEEYEGWLAFIGNWLIDIDSVRNNVNQSIMQICKITEFLNLRLSSNMKYEV